MQDWTYGVHIIDRETLRDLSILCNCQQVEARNWWVAFEDIEEQRCYGVCNTHYKKRIVHNSPEFARNGCEPNVEACNAHLNHSDIYVKDCCRCGRKLHQSISAEHGDFHNKASTHIFVVIILLIRYVEEVLSSAAILYHGDLKGWIGHGEQVRRNDEPVIDTKTTLPHKRSDPQSEKGDYRDDDHAY